MLQLYYKPTCPFCQRVLEASDSLGIEFDLLDITESDEVAEALIEKGGKRQVPYLVDEKNGVAMYESDDIIAYLKEHSAEFASKAGAEPRIHVSNAVCESCEG